MQKTLDRVGSLNTKSSEIEFLKDLVSRLPRFCYLRGILEPFLGEFEQGVYADYVPPVRESWDARIKADLDVKAVNAELESLRKQKRDLEQAVAREVARLEEVATLARKVAASADYTVSAAKSLERSTR